MWLFAVTAAAMGLRLAQPVNLTAEHVMQRLQVAVEEAEAVGALQGMRVRVGIAMIGRLV